MGNNDKIFITSLRKAVNKSKYTGKLTLNIIGLFNLYRYYINYLNGLAKKGVTMFNDVNECLKRDLDKLKYKYPNEICNYKIVVGNDVKEGSVVENTAPTVNGKSINIGEEMEYSFSISDFTTGYYDDDGDGYSTLIIYPDNLSGQLYYSDILQTTQFEISVYNAFLLKYVREDGTAFSNDDVNFKISDDNLNKKYSTTQSVTMNGVALANQPATLGDNTIYVGNKTTTVLTLSMFTSQLSPQYSDPEGDLIDAIRIDEISAANLGQLQLDGVPIEEGQLITREEINLGLFIHIGPDQTSINSDVFNFSARDEGSLIWVK